MPTQRNNVSQRRQTSSTNTQSQPLTSNDADESKSRRRRGFTAIQKTALVSLLLLGCFVYIRKQTTQLTRKLRQEEAASPSLPLSQFTDLSYALQNSDLTLLYFAASWCGMSTPISRALDEAFQEDVLTLDGDHKTLSIVYISSDRSMGDYNDYLHGRNWLSVPYESEQRNRLKQHFKTCARPEMEELNIDREHEIPTIIVIDSSNHEVLTAEGVKDVRYLKEEALDHWMQLQRKEFDEKAEIRYIRKTAR